MEEVVVEAAEVVLEEEEAVDSAEEAEEAPEVVLRSSLNHMNVSQESTSSEEKKTLLEQRTSPLENQSIKRKEFQFKSQEKKRKQNIELGTLSDQRLLLPLSEVLSRSTSSLVLKFFISELHQEQQSHMLLILLGLKELFTQLNSQKDQVEI